MPPPVPERYAHDNAGHLARLREFFGGKCVPDGEGQWVENPKSVSWDYLERAATASFPEATRGRTLLLVRWVSPYYLRQLGSDEQASYAAVSRSTVRHLEQLGFAALEFGGDYTPDDYADADHLTVSGGGKLAAAVAARVRELARRRGYVHEGETR